MFLANAFGAELEDPTQGPWPPDVLRSAPPQLRRVCARPAPQMTPTPGWPPMCTAGGPSARTPVLGGRPVCTATRPQGWWPSFQPPEAAVYVLRSSAALRAPQTSATDTPSTRTASYGLSGPPSVAPCLWLAAAPRMASFVRPQHPNTQTEAGPGTNNLI